MLSSGGVGKLPDPDDCGSYWICEAGETSDQYYCLPGTVYDPVTERCDLPQYVPCANSDITTTPYTTPGTIRVVYLLH